MATKKNQDTNKDQVQDDQRSVVEQNPDLDPNAPGIDEAERNRRLEELQRKQG